MSRRTKNRRIKKVKINRFEGKSHLSRRLRKKNRLGEYTQHGFSLSVYYNENMNPREWKHVDQLIELIESKGWHCGGGGDLKTRKLSFFISPDRGTITEDQRISFLGEVLKLSDVIHLIDMPLTEVWHSQTVDEYFEISEKKESEYENNLAK